MTEDPAPYGASPFDRLCSIFKFPSEKVLAKKLNTTVQKLSRAEKTATVPAEWLLTVLRNEGINPEWIITGKEPKRLIPFFGNPFNEDSIYNNSFNESALYSSNVNEDSIHSNNFNGDSVHSHNLNKDSIHKNTFNGDFTHSNSLNEGSTHSSNLDSAHDNNLNERLTRKDIFFQIRYRPPRECSTDELLKELLHRTMKTSLHTKKK